MGNGDFAASSIFLRVAIMQGKLVNSAVGQHRLKFVAVVIDILD